MCFFKNYPQPVLFCKETLHLSDLCVSCVDNRFQSTARGNYVIPQMQRRLADRAFFDRSTFRMELSAIKV